MRERAYFKAIAASDYAVPPGQRAGDLALELLDYLGEPDPELRDDLAYGIIARWVLAGHFAPDDYRAMIKRLTPNLTTRLGETNTDSVILRSFSALLLSVMFYADAHTPYMGAGEYRELVDKAVGYLLAEKDLRGYVPGLGWLHSCAHTADILKFAARNRHADAATLDHMLMAAAEKMTTPVEVVYIHSEDERMALAVLDILRRDLLDTGALARFVARLVKVKEMGADGGPFDLTIHATYMNVKHFLQAIYFKLALADPPIPGAHDLKDQVFEAMRQFTDF